MKSQTRTLIAVATYNEREDLPRLVEEIFHYMPAADVLVVDDNSPDGTGDWCDQRKRDEPRLDVIHRASKLGLGTALLAAMQRAIGEQYEFLVTLDADFSHPPGDIPALLSGMERAGRPLDLMIGSRYVDGARIEGWPASRKLLSRMLNLYARTWLRLTPRDCSGGFRCYRVAALESAGLPRARARGYAFLEELLWLLEQQQHARVGEMPIVFTNRRHGRSKISLREAWSAFWTIFRLGLRTRWRFANRVGARGL